MKPEIIYFREIADDRGGLVALEELKNIPFEVKRVYYIYDTPAGIRRGFHAHKELQQVAVCVKGACSFLLEDSNGSCTVRLGSPNKGLLIDKMVWHEMYDFTDDCVLMVLASELYDESDYIRSYQDFSRLVNHANT
ncbi:sugar 3,4-ketoisomerase [Endozoicomonadaceae bacterium StTr2]